MNLAGDNRSAVIAMDFGGTKVEVALADGVGSVLERERLDTHADQGAGQVLERAGEAATAMLAAAERHGVDVIACGAVSPGVILPDRVLLAPNLPGWDQVALGRWLQDLLPGRVTAVDNDVRAGALAELRAGALQDANPGIYVSLGTGIAAAVTMSGQVIRGAHGASGEIGYSSIGSLAVLGASHPNLEDLVGGKSLETRASEVLNEPTTPALLTERGDPIGRYLLHDALAALATAVGNLVVVLDPERVVVGGGLGASLPEVVATLDTRLQHWVPFPPEVTPAKFVADASLHGAIALALDAVAASEAGAAASTDGLMNSDARGASTGTEEARLCS